MCGAGAASILPQEDKLRVKLNPTIYRDQAVLHELADKCGYSVDAVGSLHLHHAFAGVPLLLWHSSVRMLFQVEFGTVG